MNHPYAALLSKILAGGAASFTLAFGAVALTAGEPHATNTERDPSFTERLETVRSAVSDVQSTDSKVQKRIIVAQFRNIN